MIKMLPWVWPLTSLPIWPDPPGRFGAIRQYDIHTGIDLYCNLGTEVVAVEAGYVVNIEKFTGPMSYPPTPWWNETQALFVEGNSGVVVYGEINTPAKIGDKIEREQIVGIIDRPILRKFKGRPMIMLHLELMSQGSRNTLIWELGQPCPANLLNPEEYLLNISCDLQLFKLETWDQKCFLPPNLNY